MNKATLKKLIPVYIDHNNKFHKIKDYFVHKDLGDVWSFKWRRYMKLKPPICKNKPKSSRDLYPYLSIHNKKIFKNLTGTKKTMDIHKIVKTSLIFHYNTLAKELIKVYKHIPKKDLSLLPKSIQEQLYRGLIVNHIDHNKRNYKPKNLELESFQGNAVKYQKHKKQKAL
jgi:hypothetical protein